MCGLRSERTQVSEALVPLEDLNQPGTTLLRPSVQKLSLLLIFNPIPPVFSDPVQSGKIKVKVGEVIK